jgi:hypothetical protein
LKIVADGAGIEFADQARLVESFSKLLELLESGRF